MRIILSILLFISIGATAQVYQTQNAPYQFTRGTKNDTILVAPRGCDTVALPSTKFGSNTIGAIYWDTCNNVLYAKGRYGWKSVATGSDIPNYIDSTGNTTNAVLFAINGRIHGSTRLTYDSANAILDVNGTSPAQGTGYKLRVNGGAYIGGTAKIINMSTTADTTLYKPVVIRKGAEDILYTMNSWPAGGSSIDTTSLSNRINLKLSISDTASMLAPYLRDGDTTGTGALYIRNTTTQEDKRFNVRAGRLDSLLASSSAGINLYSSNGTHVANYGGGGGSNATYYGGVNIDGTTRLATGLTGILKATSGTVATAVSGTDIKTINSTSLLGSGDISLPSIDSLAFRRYGNTLARNIRSFNAGGQTASAAAVNQSSSTADSSNVLIGYLSGRDLTTGYRNYFIGDLAGLTATTGHSNVAIGYKAFGNTNAKTGNANVAIGLSALEVATSAGGVVAVGSQAAASLTTAGSTIAVGNRAAQNITTGLGNVVVANYSNNNSMTALSANNTHMGSGSGFVSAALNNTSFFGSEAGQGASGNNNSGFGRNSLLNATGANNVGIGYYAGTNGGTSTLSGDNNILLGSGAKPISYSASNQFTIWAGASTATGAGGGSGGYNVFSRNSSGQWIFNQTTSEVTSISSGAAVEINGTAGGFLMPRLTASQRTAISSPATGLQVFDTDTVSVMTYNGSRWVPVDKSDYVNSTLGSPVTMTTGGTFYTGATIVLPAGTWLLTGQIAFTVPGATGTHTIEGRIYNGSASVASGHQVVPASGNRPASMSLNTVVVITGNTTYTLDLTSNVNNGQINAVTVTSSQAASTQLTAVRLR